MWETMKTFWGNLVYATDRLGSDIMRFCTDVIPVYWDKCWAYAHTHPIVAGILFLFVVFVLTSWLIGKRRRR